MKFGSGLGLEVGELVPNSRTRRSRNPRSTDVYVLAERTMATYDIFEGTEQIQQLVISRAISGMRIE